MNRVVSFSLVVKRSLISKLKYEADKMLFMMWELSVERMI